MKVVLEKSRELHLTLTALRQYKKTIQSWPDEYNVVSDSIKRDLDPLIEKVRKELYGVSR